VKTFLILWSIALVLKLILGSLLPLVSDEAYYWVWSRHLQLSYYDHGPFIAWLYWLGKPFEHLGSAVRWPGIIFGQMSVLVWFVILKPHFEPKKLQWWLLPLFLSPLIGLGSVIVTPDTPMVFFWSLGLLALLKIVETEKTLWYGILGLSLGLGFCSKYLIVFFVPIALIWLWRSKNWHRLNGKKTLFAFLLALVAASPVLIWNWQNEFSSFGFQIKHGLGREWKPRWTLEYLSSQIFLIFPPMIYFSLKARIPKNLSWLPYFAWLPLLIFVATSFRGRVEANWPVMAYPAIFVLALLGVKNLRSMAPSVLVWAFCFVGAVVQVYIPWLPVDPSRLKTKEFTQFLPVKKIAESHSPFYAGSYQMASILSFYFKKDVFKLNKMRRHDFFDQFPEGKPTEKKYFVAVGKTGKLPHWALQEGHFVVNTKKINETFRLLEVEVRNP